MVPSWWFDEKFYAYGVNCALLLANWHVVKVGCQFSLADEMIKSLTYVDELFAEELSSLVWVEWISIFELK